MATLPTSGSGVLLVRPGQTQRRIGGAAQDCEHVEVLAGGHPTDPAVWHQRSTTLRGAGGRVRPLHDTWPDRRSAGARFIALHRAPRAALVGFNSLRAGACLWLTGAASASAGSVSLPMATFLADCAAGLWLRRPAPAALGTVPLTAAIDRSVFQRAWPAGHQAAVDPAAWIAGLRPAAGPPPGVQP